MMKICVVGLGYIGLPTAAILASIGFNVVGVDINPKIIDLVNNKKIHIEETDLEEVVATVVSKGNLVAKTQPEEADAFIVAVPTPKTEDNACEVKYIISAMKSLIPYLKKGNTVIVESTIAPGTMEEVVLPLIEEAGFLVGKDLYLAHCPERVLPGKILFEIVNNDRIVGGYTALCGSKAADIYKAFTKGNILISSLKVAEMTKLVENTFRDINIAFANELVKVCDELNINVHEVIQLANRHPRVNILQPGPGVGGHCLAIDPYYIVSKAPNSAKLTATAREINSSMPIYVVSKVKELVRDIENPRIAALGMTYKENIDDVRESPSLEIINLLMKENYEVRCYDPHVTKNLGQVKNLDQAIEGADLILLLVAHNEFVNLNLEAYTKKMRRPMVFDTKNCLERTNNMQVIYLGWNER
ncbi:nucleotide sugar dehydrogenase [Alkaliphilus hydrothermalis]|uniref:UDP-N-acetyl-D-mannosaminuronic acid dehydrogenase n=1 Tax=Alkaliphilus hydrothermalis TaxID=1482730 RepID=A0ABS2NR94_9FIRM|nr:nucleotide sugar dehydrogenase [Alkaliphilus hydrothermalis]MBM7615472.1 UDP-N-acetyl-D-mannosaminuronic acid dehydrogenase [Alkaliphilus hydrothermalis]